MGWGVNQALVMNGFMNRLQPIASTLPYMTCPGNHGKFGKPWGEGWVGYGEGRVGWGVNHALVMDGFMNRLQPIASTLPYMTCPGNHGRYGKPWGGGGVGCGVSHALVMNDFMNRL